MKSYTTGRNLCGSLTKKTDSGHLTLMDELANDDYRALLSMRDWPFMERLRTLTTVASQQYLALPYDCDRVRAVAAIVSDTRYAPRRSPSQEHWDRLNQASSSSDTPEWWKQIGDRLYFWPTPSAGGATVNVMQKCRVIDLSVADYTAGTIVTATNGATAIVGSGTTWTDQMVGRWMRITYADTDNTGDGLWYEIAGFTDATNLTLARAYGGNSIAAGSASYAVGQMPLLPEAFHDLPWWWAAGTYWTGENDSRGARYLEMHGEIGQPPMVPSTGRVRALERAYGSQTSDPVLDSGIWDTPILNPNITISL